MILNYKDKYLKYKKKYLMLKDNKGGGNTPTYLECVSHKNKDFFLTLLLQLLVEYEMIYNFDSNEVGDIHSQNEVGNDHIQNELANIDFIPLMKFIEYDSETSILPVVNSKEEINNSINLVSSYLNDKTCNICKKYKKQLYSNLINEKCKKNIDNIKNQFYDSRNYSISLILNALLGEYDSWKQPPLLIYLENEDGIIDAHVFLIYYFDEAWLEAISIQTSLKILVENICDKKKYGLSTVLFDYIFNNIIKQFESVQYIYAYAWPIMSNILVKKYNFNTLKYSDYYSGNEEKVYYINDKLVNINDMDTKKIEYGLIRDLKKKALSHNSNYVFTVKKI